MIVIETPEFISLPDCLLDIEYEMLGLANGLDYDKDKN